MKISLLSSQLTQLMIKHECHCMVLYIRTRIYIFHGKILKTFIILSFIHYFLVILRSLFLNLWRIWRNQFSPYWVNRGRPLCSVNQFPFHNQQILKAMNLQLLELWIESLFLDWQCICDSPSRWTFKIKKSILKT